MKRKLKNIVLVFLILVFCSCGTTKKNVYTFSDWQLRSDSCIVLKKSNKIKKLSIQNYTNTIFPNQVISKLTKIEKLVIYSENSDSKLYKNSQDVIFDRKFENDSLFFDKNALDKLNSIRKLTLQGFSFKSFPFELCRLTSLEELQLFDCDLSEIPNDLSCFKKLKKLDLSLNRITLIQDSLILPETILILVLINNKLVDFPSKIATSTNLEEIDLSNKLFPDWTNTNKFNIEKKIELLSLLGRCPHIKKIGIQANSREEKVKILEYFNDKTLLNKFKIYVFN